MNTSVGSWGDSVVGTGALVRVILRRDRWLLLAWIVLLAGYPILGVQNASPGYVGLAESPGMLMLHGPLYAENRGALATWSSDDLLWMYGLVSLLIVIRHTRADEEAGRRDLLGATMAGRHAGLAAALAVTWAGNLVLALVTAGGEVAQGLPAAGSLAAGLKLAAVGCTFAAVGAVVAQLTESAAAARGIGGAVLGAAFVLRAASDATGAVDGGPWLSWLSPLGLANEIRPFATERWWLLALFAVLVVALTAAAVALSARRDVGAGLVRPGLGPARATPGLRGPLALAWRLHWGPLLGWVVGLAVIAGVFAGAAESAGEVFADSEQLRSMFERLGGRAGASDVFLAGTFSILGIIAAGYAVQAGLRLRTEEEQFRAEPVLATATARLRWIASHLAFSLLGPAAALAAAGLVSGLVYGITVDDVGGQIPRLLGAAMVQLIGVWVLTGIVAALFGLVPRLAPAAWAAWVAFLVLLLLDAFDQVGQTLLDLSPFTHLPKLPGGHLDPTPLGWVLGTAVALVIVGLLGFRRRDVGRT